MLKKLFISLIILSALTSEGAAGLQDYISSCLSVGRELYSCDSTQDKSDSVYEPGRNDKAFRPFNAVFSKNSISVLTDVSLLLKSKSLPYIFKLFDGATYPLLSERIIQYEIFSIYDRQIILNQSDNSPPRL